MEMMNMQWKAKVLDLMKTAFLRENRDEEGKQM